MKKSLFLSLIFYFFLKNIYASPTPLLSLEDAILLAVRDNPNVQASRLNEVSQKFSLWIQEWQFRPHYSFQATAQFTRGVSSGTLYPGSQNINIQPTVSLQSVYGTQLTLAGTNTQTSHYNPGISLQFIQPLLRGFGRAVVEANLNNARDSDYITRLNIEGILRTTITNVIHAYLTMVSAENRVLIDIDAEQRAEKSVEQTRFFIKGGHKAGNELVTVA